MRGRTQQTLGMIAVCLLAVIASSGLLGDDPAPPVVNGVASTDELTADKSDETPLPDGRQALSELMRLRDEVGESVLGGTILETSPADSRAEFTRGLQKALGLPTDAPTGAGAIPSQTPTAIVRTLRAHSLQLDRIAGELEELKQYQNADQLRDTARQLRLIARQFDQ